MASYYPGLPGQDVELAALRRSYGDACVRRIDPMDLRSELAHASEHDVLVVGVHGDDGAGLGQALLLGDGGRLHAGELLAFNSPRIVVVAACWAARLAYAAGAEPLGLATVMLATGARCFVGGLFEIGSSATGEILASFYERLRAGDGPAEALRRSQVRYLGTFEKEPAPFQWAGLVPVGSGG
jgi:CHAT domain-containing protein